MNPKNNKKIYQFGDYVLNARNRNFSNRAESIKLSSRAFDILAFLIEKHGEIVSKDEILETVWNDSFVEEGNLPVHISALRKIFSEQTENGTKFIKTISGRGYSFVAPVKEIEKSPSFFNGDSRTEKPNQLQSVIKYDASLAVLPFRHNRASEDFDYLSNGITQSLIDQLSQIPGLKVMSFSSVVGYKDSSADLTEIGYLLNVEKILIGYISEFKDRFEINVELVNADDSSQVWGMNYSFRLDEFFRIKKEISLKVAEKLKIKLTESDKTNNQSAAAEKSESYKLYLKGRYLLETYQLSESYRDGLDRALDYFRQSIDENPNYAPAYVGLARVYHNYNVYSLISRDEAYTKYRNYIDLALKLDPNLSDAYVCKGILHLIFRTNLSEAEKSLARAIQLNPNNIRAYNFLSATMTGLGRFKEAVEYQKIALELNPVGANRQIFRLHD
ncbi:winged helix-turn-helix domain-containing tetratricopeptide repeat protein [soil metagenome]